VLSTSFVNVFCPCRVACGPTTVRRGAVVPLPRYLILSPWLLVPHKLSHPFWIIFEFACRLTPLHRGLSAPLNDPPILMPLFSQRLPSSSSRSFPYPQLDSPLSNSPFPLLEVTLPKRFFFPASGPPPSPPCAFILSDDLHLGTQFFFLLLFFQRLMRRCPHKASLFPRPPRIGTFLSLCAFRPVDSSLSWMYSL